MANENICPLHFECVKQDLQRIDENIVAADAAGVLMAMFDLCDKWAGLTIYARFEHQGAVYDVPLDVERTEGGTAYKCCIVPAEVTRYNGFHVSLFGDDGDGAVLTSKRITVPVQRSIDVDGMEPIPPTPSLLESFENKAQNAVDIANSVREDANNGMFNGAPFEIKKTYPTRADMEADAANLNTGDMVLISSTVEDPDNSALYVKTSAGTLSFLCDLSGSQGVRGAAATIALGSTTVARAWTNPSVTNAGTSSDAVFKFTLPASPSFSASAQTLAPGSAATVSAVQNMSTGTLNMVFGVPQGAKGDTGETGPGVETLTTTGTGSAYKVTSVTVGASPTNGARLMIIPHTTSSVLSPTLSVNNGTARPIKRRLSTDSGQFCDLTNLYVFKQGDAVEVMYDSGSGVWILVNNPKTAANDIEGVIPIANGGTGATTASAARTQLAITPANIGAATNEHTHNAEDINVGTLPISHGGTGSCDLEDARVGLGIVSLSVTDEDLAFYGYITGGSKGVIMFVPVPFLGATNIGVSGTMSYIIRGGTGATLSGTAASSAVTVQLLNNGLIAKVGITLSTAFAGGNNVAISGIFSGLSLFATY